MIIDSHCHAWAKWPYKPTVPDEDSRGRIDQLTYEMDRNGIDKAVIICANIDKNAKNNAYVAKALTGKLKKRLFQFADIDSFWSTTYHRPGSARRLRSLLKKFPIKGITHYLKMEDKADWLYSDEGIRFFQVINDYGLILSLSCYPHHFPAVRKIAEQFPLTPILCHHLVHTHVKLKSAHQSMKEIKLASKLQNIYVKLSGFGYASRSGWNYPYNDILWIVETLYDYFGPYRLCWGSDYPVVRKYMIYEQALEMVRKHCSFIENKDMDWILGKNMAKLLRL